MAPAAQKKGKKAPAAAKKDSTPKKQQPPPQQQEQQQEEQEEVVMKEAEEQKPDEAAAPQEASEAPASAPDAGQDAVAEAEAKEDTPAVEADTGSAEDQTAVVEEGNPSQEVAATEDMEADDTGDVDEVEDEAEEDEEDAEGAENDSGDKAVEEDVAMRIGADGGEDNQEAEGSDGEGNTGADGASKDTPDDNFGPSSGKIFIGGLSRETTTEVLTRHFEKYGELTDSVIMKNRSTGQPRGFGFVTYAEPSIVDRVLQDTHIIDGRTVDAKRTVPREKMSVPSRGPKTKKVFVGGLTSSTTEDDLKVYFGKFGKISSCQIMQDHKIGKSRGFGFVTFDSEQIVEEILAQGKMHEIDGKQVEIKKAEPKRASDPPPAHERSGYVGGRRAGAGPGAGPGPYGASTGFYGGFHAADAPMYGSGGGGGAGYFNRSAGRPGGLAYGDTYGYGGGYGAPYGYGEFEEGYGSMGYGHAGYGSGSGYGYSYGGGGGYGSSSRSYGNGRYHPYSR